MCILNIENLSIAKLCLEEILEDKLKFEEENDLQDSVSYGLRLNIRDLKSAIGIIDCKLEKYR